MPEIEVRVGGRAHTVACGLGQEDQVRALAARVNEELTRLCGGAPLPANREARAMLLAALMLTDKLEEAERTISALRAEQAQTRLHAPASPPPPRAAAAAAAAQTAAPQRPAPQRPAPADRARLDSLRAERDEVANACASLLEEAADEMQRLRARLAS